MRTRPNPLEPPPGGLRRRFVRTAGQFTTVDDFWSANRTHRGCLRGWSNGESDATASDRAHHQGDEARRKQRTCTEGSYDPSVVALNHSSTLCGGAPHGRCSAAPDRPTSPILCTVSRPREGLCKALVQLHNRCTSNSSFLLAHAVPKNSALSTQNLPHHLVF
jgi:hypothetical protein